MTSKPRSVLIAVLVLTTVGSLGFAWQQYRALTTLRAASTSSDNSADLQRRLAEAEHRAHDLENQLAALKDHPGGGENPDDPAGAGDRGDRPGRLRGRDAFAAMMNDPKMVQLMNSREKLMLDGRYASLFKSLLQGSNLTPEQLETFKNLLVEKQNTTRDVLMTARAQGITDRSEINQLVKSAQAELDAQIQSTLGSSGFEQYQQYEQTLPQRNLVSQLSQSLSYTSSPLSDLQTQQLVQILADNSTSSSSNSTRQDMPGFGGGPGGAGSSVKITDAAITQAQSVLTAAQVQALVTLQQQQQAQADMIKAMRAARQTSTSAKTTK